MITKDWLHAHAQLIFDALAEAYSLLTWQETWRAHCRSVVDHFPQRAAPLRILDLGVGPGTSAIGILERLPGATVIGLDFSARMLAQARRHLAWTKKTIPLVRADGAALPFADQSFDAVTGHSFLYLVPRRQEIVQEVARVLRPGGRAVFVEPADYRRPLAWLGTPGPPQFKLMLGLWSLFSGRFGRFSAEELRSLFAPCRGPIEIRPTLGEMGLIVVAEKEPLLHEAASQKR